MTEPETLALREVAARFPATDWNGLRESLMLDREHTGVANSTRATRRETLSIASSRTMRPGYFLPEFLPWP